MLLLYGATLLHTLHILPSTRINTNPIPRINKQRHIHHCTSLQCSGLGDIVCRIATYARISAFNGQSQEVWQLYRNDLFAINEHLYLILLLQKFDGVSQHIFGDGLLVIALGIHKDIIATINIQELPVLMLDAHLINFLTGAETLLDHTTIFQILQACTYKSAPVARTDVMEFSNCVKFIVKTYDHAVTKIGGCCITQRSVPLS